VQLRRDRFCRERAKGEILIHVRTLHTSARTRTDLILWEQINISDAKTRKDERNRAQTNRQN